MPLEIITDQYLFIASGASPSGSYSWASSACLSSSTLSSMPLLECYLFYLILILATFYFILKPL